MKAKTCPACGQPMHNVVIFCEKCWWKLPAKERIGLHSLHVRGLNMDARIAKCVKILKGLK